MSTREHLPRDGWGAETARDANPAFDDERGHVRQITLTLAAPPLRLPGEEPVAAAAAARASAAPEPAHLDAWTVDRLQRSSLPPSAPRSLSAPPPPVRRPEFGLDAEEPEDGDALTLAGRASRPTPMLDLVSEMTERFALGDFSGCLRAAELLLGQDRGHDLAAHYARESREKLEELYTSRLTARGRIPVLAVLESDVRWLGLDPRVGFLISRIDGTLDYETVVELSGMSRLEALRSLVELVEGRVVRLV